MTVAQTAGLQMSNEARKSRLPGLMEGRFGDCETPSAGTAPNTSLARNLLHMHGRCDIRHASRISCNRSAFRTVPAPESVEVGRVLSLMEQSNAESLPVVEGEHLVETVDARILYAR